jgi:hypothetical protein
MHINNYVKFWNQESEAILSTLFCLLSSTSTTKVNIVNCLYHHAWITGDSTYSQGKSLRTVWLILNSQFYTNLDNQRISRKNSYYKWVPMKEYKEFSPEN